MFVFDVVIILKQDIIGVVATVKTVQRITTYGMDVFVATALLSHIRGHAYQRLVQTAWMVQLVMMVLIAVVLVVEQVVSALDSTVHNAENLINC